MLTINNSAVCTVKPDYNDIGLCDIPYIASDILSYQFLTINHNITLLSYKNHRL